MINSDYRYVREVFCKFDQLKFYQSPTTKNNSLQTEVFKKALHSNRLAIDLIIDRIASYYIQNTEDWLYMTGQLNTHREITYDSVTDRSAERLLEKLNVPNNPNITSTQQLWEYAFQEVYQDILGKEIILNAAYLVDHQNMRVTRFQICIFRVCQISTKTLSNPKTGIGIAVLCFLLLKKFEYAPMRFVSRKINIHIPKLVKFYNENTPLSVKKTINPIFRVINKIYVHRYGIFFSLLVARISLNILSIFPGRHLPLTNRCIHITQYVVEPCINILILPTKICLKLSVFFFVIQHVISNSAYNISNRQLNSTIDLAGHKAFNIWMRIHDQSKENGICRFS